MGCGCGKKKGAVVLFGMEAADGNPDTWGPVVWAILHILGERIGTGSANDVDLARDITVLIQLLPSILPCKECQNHMKTYIGIHPFVMTGLVGPELNTALRTWFMDFHNTVRTNQSKTIDITTLPQLTTLYGDERIQLCQLQLLSSHVSYGIRNGLVKQDVWKRWLTIFNRVKVMAMA